MATRQQFQLSTEERRRRTLAKHLNDRKVHEKMDRKQNHCFRGKQGLSGKAK